MRRIDELLMLAQQAASAGQVGTAEHRWHAVLGLDARHPVALNALGNLALRRGQITHAIELLGAAADAVPGEPAVQFNLALAQRAAGELREAVGSFDRALAADPYFVQAMFDKGCTLDQLGEARAAAASFRDFLDCAPRDSAVRDAFGPALEHARARVRTADEELEAFLQARLADALRCPRVKESVDHLVGRRRIELSQPTFLTVARLPAVPFFDDGLMPWRHRVDAAARDARRELDSFLAMRATDEDREVATAGFVPYVQIPPCQPKDQWAELDRSRRWGALHLWRHGRLNEQVADFFPATLAMLAQLPLFRVAGKGPNAFFSRLAPKTEIPPHHGVSNVRSVLHLPLIVPRDCALRVGNETRAWEEGRCWLFDDTILHSAWNRSEHLRIVLIVDLWNPLLSAEETAAYTALFDALATYDGSYAGWSAGL